MSVVPLGPTSIKNDRKTLLDFLQRVSSATELVEIVVAAGIAHEELTGVPFEPYPEAA